MARLSSFHLPVPVSVGGLLPTLRKQKSGLPRRRLAATICMAELLGVIAGAAGLASLALQLGETSLKLKRLSHGYKQAPKILEDVTFEIETLGLLVLQVERQRAAHDTPDETTARCLTMCQKQLLRIRALVVKLEVVLQRSNKFGRLRVSLEEQDLRQLCDELEKTKSSLMLSCQLLSE